MFSIPSADPRSYTMNNPPLVRAVVQIVFPPSLHLVNPQNAAELQDALGDAFEPKMPAEQQVGLQISFGAAPGFAQTLTFSHRDGYELAVAPQGVTLAIDERYVSRAAFSEVLLPALEAVGRIGRIKTFQRIGVRYINSAPATVEEFQRWFKPEFTGWAGSGILPNDSDRTWMLMTQIQRESDESGVTVGVIRYGYLSQGIGADVTGAAAASSPSFVADIDLACTTPGPYNANTLADLYRSINHEIAAFFQHTLREEGVEHFSVIQQGPSQ